MEPENLETRVMVLEKEMQWAKGSVESIKTDLQELKAGQNWLRDHFIELHRDLGALQSRTDTQFIEVHREMGDLRAHMEGRFVEVHREMAQLRAHADEQFVMVHKEMGQLRTHTDEQFVMVHKEMGQLRAHTDEQFVEVHKEIGGIHRAIATQTRWILAALLAGAVLYPISLKLIDRLFSPPVSPAGPIHSFPQPTKAK